jgi:hypothetical protein
MLNFACRFYKVDSHLQAFGVIIQQKGSKEIVLNDILT